MSDCIKCIDDLLTTFEQDTPSINTEKPKNTLNTNPTLITKCDDNNDTNGDDHKTTCNKHKNGTTIKNIDKPTSSQQSSSSNNQSDKPQTPPPVAVEDNDDDAVDDEKETLNETSSCDEELTEEEALRLAMEMSMTEDDRQLISCIKKEIHEQQGHLSNWFQGNFKSVRDKNRAWCDFCKRLHHQFSMYRIEHGIIQPLSYQFFIQFIALLYGTMNDNGRQQSGQLTIDQHKIKNIILLSADDDAIKYLRFAQGISKSEVKSAVYAKFQSLALDPMAPNEWKYNHVMFIRSEKAPNGLLWAKWHMQ